MQEKDIKPPNDGIPYTAIVACVILTITAAQLLWGLAIFLRWLVKT